MARSCLGLGKKLNNGRFRASGNFLARVFVLQRQALAAVSSAQGSGVFHSLTYPLPALSPFLTPTSASGVRCSAVDNEAALSVTPVAFHNRNGESFVAVGTAKGLTFHPRSHEGCFVHMYR